MGAGESSSALKFGTCDLHGRTHMDPSLQLGWRTRAISLVLATAGKLGWAEGREGRHMTCMLLSIFLNGTQQRRFRGPAPSQAPEGNLN